MTNIQQDRQQSSWIVANDTLIDCGVGNRLRDYYEPTIGERLPDRFPDLLRRADASFAFGLTSHKA